MCAKKNYVQNPATCCSENDKYVIGTTDNSVIRNDKIIDPTKTVPRKTVPIQSTSTNFYILLAFLLITIALLTAVTIYCYVISSKTKIYIATLHHKQLIKRSFVLIIYHKDWRAKKKLKN